MRSANMAFSRVVERYNLWLILLAWLACSAVMLWLFHGDFAALHASQASRISHRL
jgi:uncharacterized membrane protein YjjP (DUF1212 family)